MLKDSSGISDQRVCSERKWLRGFMCQEEVLSGITVTAQEQVNAARRCADSCGRRRGAELKKKRRTKERSEATRRKWRRLSQTRLLVRCLGRLGFLLPLFVGSGKHGKRKSLWQRFEAAQCLTRAQRTLFEVGTVASVSNQALWGKPCQYEQQVRALHACRSRE